jgi:hypothetical protein
VVEGPTQNHDKAAQIQSSPLTIILADNSWLEDTLLHARTRVLINTV